MTKKILLLGSGELGKEFVIAAKRLGQYVVACDSYAGAPAMQVADACEVFDMLDGDRLEAVVAKHDPDIIVPEIEAIRTERLYACEKRGIQVVPSARAVNFTMNRKSIRDLAAEELGLKTAKYFYAKSFDELKAAAERIGFPCVVKPLMSSSGKGSRWCAPPTNWNTPGNTGAAAAAATSANSSSRSSSPSTARSRCSPSRSRTAPRSSARRSAMSRRAATTASFQPAPISPEHLAEAQAMAAKVTQALTGAGLWGVEFFLSHDKGVYFSELSPRPHDTGMVTLAGTQNLNEFELHCRAVLGLPIPRITLEHTGASAVILSPIASREQPRYRGEEEVCREENTDLRIFGKPSTKLNRRMGVVVRYDALDADLDALRDKTKAAAAKVEVY